MIVKDQMKMIKKKTGIVIEIEGTLIEGDLEADQEVDPDQEIATGEIVKKKEKKIDIKIVETETETEIVIVTVTVIGIEEEIGIGLDIKKLITIILLRN